MGDVTQILSDIEHGDPNAADELLPLVYEELRKLAAIQLAKEKAGQTLQATALVHEAYIRLVDHDRAQHWNSRGHFFAAAAESVRRILVEQARKKNRLKRGGGVERVNLERLDLVEDEDAARLIELDDALAKLSEKDPQKASLVKLRFFAGLTVPQAAQSLGISTSTADRHWAYARAWLHREMASERRS